MLTLRYEDGTIRIDGLDESDAAAESLPDVAWDDRGLVARAPAFRYAGLSETLGDRGVAFEDRVAISEGERLSLSHAYDLRPYQEDAVAAWHEQGDRGVVVLPTGAGKTVVAIDAIATLGVPTLVVVPTIDLLEQWRRELETEFEVAVGQFGGGEQTQAPITVSTYDSAYLRAEDVGGDFGFIVFDEVHHLGGEGYRDAARLVAAPARLGLTATFERPDGAHEVVADLVGPKVYEAAVDDLAGEHLADYEIRRIEVALGPDERAAYEDAQGTFVEYLKRSNLLPAITSETGAAERREILERFRDGTYSRVVTANVLDEGVDVPDANVAVVLAGSGSEREFTQRLGRILRPSAGGGPALLYEIVSEETAEERVADRRR